MSLTPFLAAAESAARAAGALVMSHYGQLGPGETRYKSREDIVTRADRESEALLAERLLGAFPGHGFLGEETGLRVGDGHHVWVVDPLDGTVNFAAGVPCFCVSVALFQAGRPVVGVVFDPTRDELFAAAEGAGATMNGLPIRVDLEPAVRLVSTSSHMVNSDFRDGGGRTRFHGELLAGVGSGKLRLLGAEALHLAYIAAGRLHVNVNTGVKLWDDGAGALLVTEAGGRISRLDGEPLFPLAPDSPLWRGVSWTSVSTNGVLHDEILARLGRALEPVR